jgi:hypothetical protein
MAKQGSIVGSMLWMIVISILLFWLPMIGPFIGGLVGGKKAGSVGRALSACFLPAFLAAVFIFVMLTLGGVPFAGFVLGGIFGGAMAVFILTHGFSLIGGAIVGGALA